MPETGNELLQSQDLGVTKDMSPERSRPPLPEGVNQIDQAMVDRAAREAVQKIEKNPVVNIEGREVVKIGGGSLDMKRLREEVFGKGQAFTREWAARHDLPEKVVIYDPVTRDPQTFIPEQVFSEFIDTGLSDTTAFSRANIIIDKAPDRETRVALRNGLLRAFIMNVAMKTSRFDPLVQEMAGGNGLRPSGISQWLMEDVDTRRALTKIFELQGYVVPPTADKEGNVVNDPSIGRPFGVRHSFSDLNIESAEVHKYLQAISEKTDICPGVVTVAYTMFRVLGFAQENGKFKDLYDRAKKDGLFNLDPDPRKHEVSPFIQKIRDPRDTTPKDAEGKDRRRFLDDVLRSEGVLGLALSLDVLGEAELARAWDDTDKLLEVGDLVMDVRDVAGANAHLSAPERRATIIGYDKLRTLKAKRRLSDNTYNELIDSRKISKEQPLTKMGYRENNNYFWSHFFNTLPVIGGMLQREAKARRELQKKNKPELELDTDPDAGPDLQ